MNSVASNTTESGAVVTEAAGPAPSTRAKDPRCPHCKDKRSEHSESEWFDHRVQYTVNSNVMDRMLQSKGEILTSMRQLQHELSILNYQIKKLAMKMQLPFHCDNGTVRKSYANERYGKPRKYKLAATVNGLSRRQRIITEGVK